MRATAAVKDGMTVIGTGFLVGPDTVLTAAHVALDGAGKLKPNLAFLFSDPSVAAEGRSFRPKSQDPVAFSPAYGQPPLTKRNLDPDSDQHLDYVLLRLTGRVNGIKPIDIAPAPQQNSGAHVFIFGYRGGTAVSADVFAGIMAKTPGKRFIHTLNTVGGMSGSPCIGPSGEAIGLHEAGFEIQQNGEKFFENRAVDASHVLQDILARSTKPKPLAPLASATDYGIYDPALRLGWASADKCWPAPRMRQRGRGRS
jgi:Trypsin-like peptidase domain